MSLTTAGRLVFALFVLIPVAMGILAFFEGQPVGILAAAIVELLILGAAAAGKFVRWREDRPWMRMWKRAQLENQERAINTRND